MATWTFDWDAALAAADARVDDDPDMFDLSEEEREEVRGLIASREWCVHAIANEAAPRDELLREILGYEEELARYGLV